MSDQVMKKCGSKECVKAGEFLPSFAFGKNKNTKSKLSSWCKECSNKKKRLHLSIGTRRQDKTRKQKVHSQTPLGRYSKYKHSAKIRNIEFNLSYQQFEIITNKICYYCDDFSSGKKFVGIDRINSAIGYNLRNCVPCCETCNYMKNDMEFELMFQKCKKIVQKENYRRLFLQKQYDVDYDTYL